MKNSTGSEAWKILIIEDDEDDFLLIRDMLARPKRGIYTLVWVSTYETGLEALRDDVYDAVLLDYYLGARDGLALLREVRATDQPFPFILFSGSRRPEAEVEVLEAGAVLYLTKDEINQRALERGIHYAIALKQKEEALRKANAELAASNAALAASNAALAATNAALAATNAALRESESLFFNIFENAPFAISLARLDNGRLMNVNPAWSALTGFEKAEVIGHTSAEFGMISDAKREAMYQEVRAQGVMRSLELVFRTKSGADILMAGSAGIVTVAGVQYLLSSFENITARKQAEQEREWLLDAVQYQKGLFERLVQSAPIGIAVLHGPEHRFVLVNEVQRGLFPMIPTFEGRTVAEVWPEQADFFTPFLDRVFQTGEPHYAVDAVWQTDKGRGLEETFYTFSYTPLYEPGGAIEGILVLSVETTEQVRIRQQIEAELAERERAEAALIVERNRVLAVMETLPVGLAIYDTEGGVVQANQGFERVWGHPRPEANSVADFEAYRAWWVDTGERVRPEEWAAARAVQQGLTIIGQFMEIERFDGARAFVLNSGAPIRDASGAITGCVVAIMDITEQHRLELEQSAYEKHKEIQRRLAEFRAKERQEIARNIHDGPIQSLVGLLFNVQVAKETLPDPLAQQEFTQIGVSLQNTVRELREVISQLRPPSLLQLGLSRALKMFAEDFREKYPEVTLEASISEDRSQIPEDASLALFRICQEGMNNIVRHAQARCVWLRLDVEHGAVRLEVRDDGQGFEMPASLDALTGTGHYGMAGMQERAEALGGSLTVRAAPGAGTTLRVTLPIS